MNLYDITVEYQELMNLLEESGGEITPEIEEMMKKNDEDFASKVEGYVKIIKNFTAHSDSLKAEIKRLQDLKKTKDNSINRLKDNLAASFQVRGEDKYDGGTFKVSFRKSSKLVYDGITDVPEQYIENVPKVLNSVIKDAIKNGENVPGFSIQENKNIQIR